MSTSSPDVSAAKKILTKLRAAAPPVAARRLDDVIAVLEQLQDANQALTARLTDQRFDRLRPPSDQLPDIDTGGFDAHLQSILAERNAELTSDDHPGIASALAELTEEERTALIDYLSEGQRHPPPSVGVQAADPAVFHTGQTGIISDIPADDVLLLRAGESLRSPLIGLRGQAESLLAGKIGRVTPEMGSALRMMQDSADGALALIDSVETLRSLRDGAVEIRYTTFAPSALVRAASAQFERQASAQDNILTLVVEETLPEVYADFAAALVVLSDLIDNALRYSPAGGATRISAEPLGTHILFTVADTGIGLTDDDIHHVGQAFWRAAHQPLVRQHTGTGLRLFIARKVLALMGGEMFLSGDAGLGSSFSFTLPIAI